MDVNQIFKDLGMLVHEQGEVLGKVPELQIRGSKGYFSTDFSVPFQQHSGGVLWFHVGCPSVSHTSVHLEFCFGMISWVNVSGFSPNMVCKLILLRSDLDLLMSKFHQFLTEPVAHLTIVVGYYYALTIWRIVERINIVTPVHPSICSSPSASGASNLCLSFSGGGIHVLWTHF